MFFVGGFCCFILFDVIWVFGFSLFLFFFLLSDWLYFDEVEGCEILSLDERLKELVVDVLFDSVFGFVVFDVDGKGVVEE